MADEEELVAQPGEVPGEGAQGPDRMAVAGTVDPIENLSHMAGNVNHRDRFIGTIPLKAEGC